MRRDILGCVFLNLQETRGQTELTPIVGDVIVGTVPSVPSLFCPSLFPHYLRRPFLMAGFTWEHRLRWTYSGFAEHPTRRV
jgi:hypothetical protein